MKMNRMTALAAVLLFLFSTAVKAQTQAIVPFAAGGAPAMTDHISGQVPAGFGVYAGALPHVRAESWSRSRSRAGSGRRNCLACQP